MTTHLTLAGFLSLCCALAAFPAHVRAQTDPESIERLRRDQDEILRKAERLQALMQRLQQRFEREGKKDQVRLIQEGLSHLERSGLLRDVASIRDDLAATALTEALRKQKEVVDDLERLLNILLERKSVEQLEQQMQVAAEQAATARELERRQSELIDATRNALRSATSEARKQLLDRLAEIAASERRESERNAVQAGSRRPFLESALERVRALLRDQDRLEAAADDEAAGRTDGSREREFDLGSLAQRTRDLERRLKEQQQQDALADAAQKLREQATSTDAQALQQARERLEVLAQDAPRQAGPEGPVRDPRWSEVLDGLRKAPDGALPAEREQLAKLGEEAENLARQRSAEAGAANAKEAGKLSSDAQKLAERLRQHEAARHREAEGGDAPKDGASAAVEQAAEKLAAAEKAAQGNDPGKARERVNEAAAALDQARTRNHEQNPDAARKAAQMAAESAATAQEIQNAPSAETAEQTAGEHLERAANALRETESGLERARETGSRPDVGSTNRASREALQAAEKALDGALQASNEGGKEDRAGAAQRQEQLQKAAEDLGRQMEQAAASGQIDEQQRARAGERMAEAQRRMQEATRKLQDGQQAGAAGAQQKAADALEQAGEELQKDQKLDDRQREQLREQGKQQQELTEDILRLAQELKKRQNKSAERAVEQAADAAQKARNAMEQGDQEETEQQQEAARKKLQEAADQLEEEKDRYQDLRQEELLFRMRDELVAFLERQRPITGQTLDAQKSAPAEGLSRPVRRKLNQLGEEEVELAGRIEFLVNALTDEGNLVYRSVLQANLDDLREVGRRLAGRAPDPGTFTTMLQQDVERRSEELLKALERERQRREQERQQQQQDQQQQGRNRLNDQREKLVSLIAELEMLKQLGQDTRRANDNLRTLVESRGDTPTTEAESQMIERLAHRHGEITKLFQQIKRDVEASMQAMQQQEGQDQEGGRGR